MNVLHKTLGMLILVEVLYLNKCLSKTFRLNQQTFPKSFVFGAASSAFQIEGAWNEDGKGESIWDKYTHDNQHIIFDRTFADVSCNSYRKYKDDVKMLKDLGVNFYRFSIAWTRILPTGYVNKINKAGINYYNNLINELIRKNIEPLVTIYHWDLPQSLQALGGWPNPVLIEHFVNYAKVLFKSFGDRVKKWITFNEPKQTCKFGYGDGKFAPAYNSSGLADYQCLYTIVKAHAEVYHLYQKEFKDQGGLIGYTIESNWFKPRTSCEKHKEAADRLFEFNVGLFANPIYGTGDFPEVVKDRVDKRSKSQGFSSSRLPSFTAEDMARINGTADFLGLNYYSAVLVKDLAKEASMNVISWASDTKTETSWDPDWSTAASFWLKVVPEGIRHTLKTLTAKYGNIPIFITENGYSDHGYLVDYERINYHLLHLSYVLEAIHEDKINVMGYTAWSLMDNYEWLDGYHVCFGLYAVHFNDPERERIPKKSAGVYAKIIRKRKLPESTFEVPAVPAKVSHPCSSCLFITISVLLYIWMSIF